MEKLPQQLAEHFDNKLHQDTIPINIQFYYKKWLRYYWDFCHKYRHNPFDKASLPLFLKKLQDKQQSGQQQNQAQHAITLLYQIETFSTHRNTNDKPASKLSSLSTEASFWLCCKKIQQS